MSRAGGPACDKDSPISVAAGSANAGDDPKILALIPNNPPSKVPKIVDLPVGP